MMDTINTIHTSVSAIPALLGVLFMLAAAFAAVAGGAWAAVRLAGLPPVEDLPPEETFAFSYEETQKKLAALRAARLKSASKDVEVTRPTRPTKRDPHPHEEDDTIPDMVVVHGAVVVK
jgi:hypothetical protein